MDCNGVKTNRNQYLSDINRAYDEKFEDLKQYKHEDNFERMLKKLTIEDVISAVNRSKRIMDNNKESGYQLLEYKGYHFYKENPSLSVWEIVSKILKECGVIDENSFS